eukprot:1006467_1
MKILFKKIIKDGSGEIKVDCEIAEDFWHVYNLLRIGDHLTSVTIRNVSQISSTGSSNTKRIKTRITLLIDTIDYDTSTSSMRVKGTNIIENKHISLGQSHTIDLCLNRPFTIHKKKWDMIDLKRIDMASNPAKSADLAVIVMEHGLAHLCLITSEMTITKAKIDKKIPRKRIG